MRGLLFGTGKIGDNLNSNCVRIRKIYNTVLYVYITYIVILSIMTKYIAVISKIYLSWFNYPVDKFFNILLVDEINVSVLSYKMNIIKDVYLYEIYLKHTIILSWIVPTVLIIFTYRNINLNKCMYINMKTKYNNIIDKYIGSSAFVLLFLPVGLFILLFPNWNYYLSELSSKKGKALNYNLLLFLQSHPFLSPILLSIFVFYTFMIIFFSFKINAIYLAKTKYLSRNKSDVDIKL